MHGCQRPGPASPTRRRLLQRTALALAGAVALPALTGERGVLAAPFAERRVPTVLAAQALLLADRQQPRGARVPHLVHRMPEPGHVLPGRPGALHQRQGAWLLKRPSGVLRGSRWSDIPTVSSGATACGRESVVSSRSYRGAGWWRGRSPGSGSRAG